MQETRQIKIAIVGCGVVGSSLIQQLHEKHDRILDEYGFSIRISHVLVRNRDTQRDVPDKSILYSSSDQLGEFSDIVTTNSADIINSDANIVVEVAGGIHDAYDIIKAALASSHSVVTANKELLALKGNELYALAGSNRVDLLFEAAVAGAIPIVRPIRESLAVEHINSVRGILNGTTNFILTQMTRNGMSYEAALAEATALGYAEADPTADVEGYDAAAKIAIISLLATGANALQSDVQTRGISGVTVKDIATATELGYVIKLIAVVQERNTHEVIIRVDPTFVPITHPLSTVHDGFNAVTISGERSGELTFIGRGAGGDPTAAAALGDVVDACINVDRGRSGAIVGFEFDRTIADPGEWESEFYIDSLVEDQPGVLAQIAGVAEHHGISIRSLSQQPGKGANVPVRLLLLTHETRERSMLQAAEELNGLSCVQRVGPIYPVLS